MMLRAVAIDKGRHRVEFRYRAPLLRAGATLSLCSWALWLALFWRRRSSADSVAPALAPGLAEARTGQRRAVRREG